RRLRERFERESGDLQGLVHLRMLGQGYDFPPITIVVPMRPYGSFAEFYQFIGRGIRILTHPALIADSEQILDIVFHSELGLEEHLEDLRHENDMEPWIFGEFFEPDTLSGNLVVSGDHQENVVGPTGPEVYVLTTPGKAESGVLHTPQQIERRQQERERDALATAYARYVESSPTPISFEQYLELVKQMRHE
ncbi:MAG: restriction endonuclease subunit R, partial [Anaerolineae bacterium]|nr:restriction endonuclease subunit R [Anaerolineae bacterium]